MYSEAYKDALCLLCRQSALFEHYKKAQKEGKRIETGELQKALEMAMWAKAEFLREKESLGFQDGIDFMSQELFFAGFSYKDGTLLGDTKNLPAILTPWLSLEENAKNHWKYEVATLLLSHYYMEQEQYHYIGIFQKLQSVLGMGKRFAFYELSKLWAKLTGRYAVRAR